MSIQTPRISVRGLMILVLVLGAWMGWKIHRARAQRRAVAAIRGVGGRVDYDWQADPSRPGEYSSYGPGPARGVRGPLRRPPAPDWVRRITGDEFLQEVARVNLGGGHMSPDDLLPNLASFPHLKHLSLINGRGSARATFEAIEAHTTLESLSVDLLPGDGMTLAEGTIDDLCLARLKGLTSLRKLHLRVANPTDAGLEAIAGLTGLEELKIPEGRFTNAGLATLRRMPGLRKLAIGIDPGVILNAEGLAHLGSLADLEQLYLSGRGVDDGAWHALERSTKLKGLWLKVQEDPGPGDGLGRLRAALPFMQVNIQP